MLSLIETVYPDFRHMIIQMETGAPKAWEWYTLRPNVWLCGDSIFPGGGTIGTTASGLHCARSIAPGLFEL
jgi:hypothetical protein